MITAGKSEDNFLFCQQSCCKVCSKPNLTYLKSLTARFYTKRLAKSIFFKIYIPSEP